MGKTASFKIGNAHVETRILKTLAFGPSLRIGKQCVGVFYDRTAKGAGGKGSKSVKSQETMLTLSANVARRPFSGPFCGALI